MCGDGGFVYDLKTGRYGFQEGSEYGSEDEFDLMNDPDDDDEDTRGEGTEEEDSSAVLEESVDSYQANVGHSYDLGQSTDKKSEDDNDLFKPEEPKEKDIELKSRFKQDPDFQKKVMSLARGAMRKDKEVLASKAETFSPSLVGEFLASIKLDKYMETFISKEVSGDVLLDADEEFLSELGVDTALDQVKILTLFPRRLEEVDPKYPVSEVVKCLQENKLGKYAVKFEENEIDGDMILATDPALMKVVLEEIGVGLVDRVKILSKFKTYVRHARR